MNERILIAGGCSYTDKNFRTLAPDFVMQIKLGQCGQSIWKKVYG